ncbi:dihydrofolate synthase [Klebsiella pneumoniae]|uniref:Dihydrofolate synthase n=1 Tax=Klebsiella pneumoniae TaxID=573 RepID=A0A2X3GU04_KLEPN|nr:dihydrofolate synthase [Klebsiella pneumoniae]
MDIVKPAPFVFTVAGTNGKGTTCRTLETILMAAGYKVGGLQLSASGALHRTRAHSGG